jgi:aminoglycoside/choline kinase family phosphotransferase
MKISLTTNTDKKELTDQVTAAVTGLNTIIGTTKTMTTAQLTAAVKELAKYERAIIKRVIQLI